LVPKRKAFCCGIWRVILRLIVSARATRNQLVDLPFDEQLKERRVKFDIVETGRGPRAVNIQPIDLSR
jgi:hypothetical protein